MATSRHAMTTRNFQDLAAPESCRLQTLCCCRLSAARGNAGAARASLVVRRACFRGRQSHGLFGGLFGGVYTRNARRVGATRAESSAVREHRGLFGVLPATRNARRVEATRAESAVERDQPFSPETAAGRSWVGVVILTAVCMLLCNTDRSLLGVAVVPIAQELSLDAATVGVLQSSYLWGYGLGQIPAGLLADHFGGPRVLLFGLVLWSVATCMLPLARHSTLPLVSLVIARAIFGLGSAVALPATSATVSAVVPATRRASSLSAIYSIFNAGSIVGLATTPAFISAAGWPAVFHVYGVIGIIWALIASALLPESVRSDSSAAAQTKASAMPPMVLRKGGLPQVIALFWVHCVIGWGFFLLLSYIPTYLLTQFAASGESLAAVGLASSLPWLVSALTGVVAGGAADALLSRGWPVIRVRTTMHAIASLGPAVAVAALPLVGSKHMAVALLCLVTGCQAFNYSAFHALVATVAGNRSGFLLALTNTGGIVMGILANLSAGFLLSRFGSFGALFAITAGLYASSFAVWVVFIRGDDLYVKPAGGGA